LTHYDAYTRDTVTHHGFTGFPSIAARHTALEQQAIQFDCGYVPRETGNQKLVVLITHFHADHGSDVCNCVSPGKCVTIFVPAYCAEPLFTKIKCDISMQKGRPYTDQEIVKMVRIIGCKRDNGEFKDQKQIFSKESNKNNLVPDSNTLRVNDLVICELIGMGDRVRCQLRGREEVFVEPFPCFHTVDTCGYVVHTVRKKLADQIVLEPGTEIEINCTEDQDHVKKKGRKKKKKNPGSVADGPDTLIPDTLIPDTLIPDTLIPDTLIPDTRDPEGPGPDDMATNPMMNGTEPKCYDWTTDEKYHDIRSFIQRHDLRPLTNGTRTSVPVANSTRTSVPVANSTRTSVPVANSTRTSVPVAKGTAVPGTNVSEVIVPTIVEKQISPKFTLKVRRLTFTTGLRINTKDTAGTCILSPDDFAFFKKYKIGIYQEHVIPETMFFGDTCSYVFHPKHKQIQELLATVKTVIIESTYLEHRHEMSVKKFKERSENRHMFLFELEHIFNAHPDTVFILIHFSACYSKTMIRQYTDQCMKRYGNVTAFI
jgi:ribonuclease BN (tRNA processing enzyme)